MNEKKYLSYLERYSQWLKAHKEKSTEELAEREAHAKEMQKYDKARLLSMTADDVYNLLSPLWAMGMWGNKHYKIDNLIETNSIELIRAQFANLLYGKDSLAKRWDEFRQKIKGIGPGIMSEILNKAFPDDCILWNSKTKTGFTILEVPNTPKYDSAMDGKIIDASFVEAPRQCNTREENSDMCKSTNTSRSLLPLWGSCVLTSNNQVK